MTHDLLVYTALFGDRDVMRPPERIDGFDWRFVTDNENCQRWDDTIVTPMPIPGDPRRSARLIKIMPHLFFPNYERWVWMDGNLRLHQGVNGDSLNKIPGPISVFNHRDRDCLYKEAWICSHFKLDDPETIEAQIAGYRQEGFPTQLGLAETGGLIRDNTSEIRAFNRRWWKEVSTKSLRDQLSFNYCAWKENLQINYIGKCTGTPWFYLEPHAT